MQEGDLVVEREGSEMVELDVVDTDALVRLHTEVVELATSVGGRIGGAEMGDELCHEEVPVGHEDRRWDVSAFEEIRLEPL